MKQNWEYKKLGEVCLIERGGSPRPITAYITDAEDGVNWIKIGDAEEGSRYINSTKEKIKPEGVKKSRFVHKGDFILSNSMSFGKPYILGIDGCIHDGWLVIHDTNNTFDKDYLYYTLGSKNMYAKFKSLAVGGVVNNLNSDLVRKVSVPVPPLSTQTAIVSELDALSAIIADHKSLLKKYDELEQSIFYHMFGDPVKNDKGWEVKKLGEVGEIVGGTTPKTNIKEYWNGEYCWITPAELKGEKFISNTERKITSSAIKSSNLQILPIGTVLLSSRAPIGKVAIIEKEMYCNQGFKNIICSDKVDKEYIYMWLLLQKDYLNELGTGATFKEISKKVVSNIDIPLPPLPLQQEFALKIEAIEAMKADTKKSLAKSEELFNARMDYYFNA